MEGRKIDPARTWHGLDSSLEKLREALPGFEEAGRDDLLECLEELIDETSASREKAEREVAGTFEDGPEEVSER